MKRVNAIIGWLRRGVAAWFIVGFLVWSFLATPYLTAAVGCLNGDDEIGKIECLKPVAQELREDSNIATYATATVAAIIALQLANRNRRDGERGRGDDDAA